MVSCGRGVCGRERRPTMSTKGPSRSGDPEGRLGTGLPDTPPTALAAFEQIQMRKAEAACEQATDSAFVQKGGPPLVCLERLGTVLMLLGYYSACGWGCPGGDHLLARLVAQAVTSAGASLRLMRAGYYDDALSLLR